MSKENSIADALLCELFHASVRGHVLYFQVKDKSNGTVYIVAESRLGQLPVKAKASGKKQATSKGSMTEAVQGGLDTESYELLAKIPGSSLVGLK